MTQKRILLAILLLMVLDGFIDATYAADASTQPLAWSVPLTLCFSFLTFLWYRRDSEERGYARSRWLNIGIILLTPFSVPYYLLRSRPPGQKLRALMKCAGFATLIVLSAAIGMILTGHPL
jgi:peptidoglycan/LPS O-acetylase OafA/YrhL